MERMLSVVATCRQQGRNVLEYLTSCFEADHRGQPIPSLVPADQTANQRRLIPPIPPRERLRLAAPEPARPLGSIQTSIRDGYFNHSHDDSSSFDARSRMGERALLTRGPLAGCPTDDSGRSPSPASP